MQVAKGSGGKKRRINEPGIEQTGVAFDVTLADISVGTAGLRSNLKASRSHGGTAECFEETPQASGLAAGFFFRQGRGAIPVASS
jgi:hypothetical protein